MISGPGRSGGHGQAEGADDYAARVAAVHRIFDEAEARAGLPSSHASMPEPPSAAARAAGDAAIAALRARPPARCPRCGPSTWQGPGPTGFWRCNTCWADYRAETPTAAEEDAAARQARDAVTADEARDRLAAFRYHVSTEELRDRRSFAEIRRGLRAALLHRAAPDRYPATAAAREFLEGFRLIDFGKKALEVTGHADPYGLGNHELAMAMLHRPPSVSERYGWWPAPMTRGDGFTTTSDLPSLLDNVTTILFLDAYTVAPKTFASWTRAVEVADFRQTVLLTPGFPSLELVAEHGEYTRHTPTGPATPIRVLQYGRMIALTRQAVLADDLLTFNRLVEMLGLAAASLESDVTYALLTSNPVLPYGFALFSSQHANLMAPAALSAASLATACSALAAQKTADGTALHLVARYVLVGPTLGPAARALIASTTPLDATPDAGTLSVIQDDRIAGDWYVACDPRQHDTLVTAHLAASPVPELLAKDGWEIDGREYKGRDTFGAAVADYRGLVKTPGA